jgi:hypothetical protein
MNGKRRRACFSKSCAPSRSCMFAGRTLTPSRSPSVSTRISRLRPTTFLPAVASLLRPHRQSPSPDIDEGRESQRGPRINLQENHTKHRQNLRKPLLQRSKKPYDFNAFRVLHGRQNVLIQVEKYEKAETSILNSIFNKYFLIHSV